MSHQNNDTHWKPENMQKLRSGLSSARHGELPTNETVVSGLDHFNTSTHVDNVKGDLSPAGQLVVDDTRKVLQDIKELVSSRNEGDALQQAVWHSREAVRLSQRNVAGPSSLAVGTSPSEDLADLASSTVQLGKLMVTSGEFRDVLVDLLELLRVTLNENTPLNIPEDVRHHKDIQDLQENIHRARSGGQSLTETSHHVIDDLSHLTHTIIPQDELDKAKARVQERHHDISHRETAKHVIESARHVPEERKQLIRQKLRHFLEVVSTKEEYQKGVEDVIMVFESLRISVSEQAHSTKSRIPSEANEHSKEALRLVKQVLENSAGGVSLDTVVNESRNLARMVNEDRQVREVYDEWRDLLRTGTLRPAEISSERIDTLSQRTRDLGPKFKEHTVQIQQGLRLWRDGVVNDPLNRRFATDVKTLATDLFFDDNGRPALKSGMARDMGKVVKAIADEIAYIPVPRIEHDDQSMHLVLDDINVKASGLLPEYVHIAAEGTYDRSAGGMSGLFTVSVSKITAEGRGIYYEVERKSFPRIRDSGTADFELGGDNGLSFDLVVRPTTVDGTRKVEVVSCECNIDKLKVRLHDSRHQMLYRLFRGVIERMVRKNVEVVVADRVRLIFEGSSSA